MYSYAERLKNMRETKIRHTLEKKAQCGYIDQDDYGTVPVPEGYMVELVYNGSNGAFYGYEAMAENFKRLMDATPPYVDVNEMLCARWRDMFQNYRCELTGMPKWNRQNFEKLPPRETDPNNKSLKTWDEQRFPFDHLKPGFEKYNIVSGITSDSHFAGDFKIGLELGFGGLLEKIEKYRKTNPDKKAFYDAEEKIVVTIIDFIKRHITHIEQLMEKEQNKDIYDNLYQMKTACQNILTEPPKTLHEACQWIVFFKCASRMYTRDGAGFQLDEILLPYYEHDIKLGLIDDEKAKFIIANLILTDTQYYQLSGVDENDKDITNHLSFLILDAANAINVSCNITVRVHKNCNKELIKKAVYYLIKNKNGWPRFCGDDSLTNGYMKNGIDKKTARERIAVGCNWMAIPGKEFPMNDTVKINIAKVFECALNDMRSSDKKSTQKLFELFEEHLKKAVEYTAGGINLHLDHQWEVTPELVLNLIMHNTLETGEDISRCADLFTVGIDGVGLAVVADSLGAITTRIEKEQLITWDELYAALDSNFEDERTRLMLNSSPKYCSGGSDSDRWATEITKLWVKTVKSQPMPKGRQLIPGWFSWSQTISFGKNVGATPNGRKSGEPVSHGANPNPHFRTDGAVTAQANGIASVQCGYGNTAPLQLEFDPHLALDEKGVDTIVNLITSHLEQGGTLININILDTQKLMEANQNPELHPDLVVRVTGFTAYFASLSPQFRQLVVDRFLQG